MSRNNIITKDRSFELPVAEHFNTANHTIDNHDIRVCRVKQCSGSNTSRKLQQMQLIFELGTLKPGGLNINLFFVFVFILRTRALVVRFLCHALRAHFSVRL